MTNLMFAIMVDDMCSDSKELHLYDHSNNEHDAIMNAERGISNRLFQHYEIVTFASFYKYHCTECNSTFYVSKNGDNSVTHCPYCGIDRDKDQIEFDGDYCYEIGRRIHEAEMF